MKTYAASARRVGSRWAWTAYLWLDLQDLCSQASPAALLGIEVYTVSSEQTSAKAADKRIVDAFRIKVPPGAKRKSKPGLDGLELHRRPRVC